MNKYGLLGSNVSFSFSKLIHESLYKENNLNYTYDLISTTSDKLVEFINKLKSNEYSGFNVTIPYKTEILQYVDVLSDNVKEIGACNTVYCKDGLIYADNTDYYGFDYLLDYHNIKLDDTFILGTGGSSKAICSVLDKRNIKYTVIGRDESKDYIFLKNNLNNHGIINTTPIGMYPNVDQSVLEKEVASKASLIIDIIYNPRQTLLMSYNDVSYNGLVMLVYQAVKSFEIWTNINIKKESVNKIIKEIG